VAPGITPPPVSSTSPDSADFELAFWANAGIARSARKQGSNAVTIERDDRRVMALLLRTADGPPAANRL
jgi:hypothetical protein